MLAILMTTGGHRVSQPTFEQFFRGIIHQESGGNYNAVGPSVQGGHHAYGRYQVMDYNIPSWTKQYYGKSLTPEQFKHNHEAQDAVARGRLKSYYNKYGARGAAAMWYSGQSNPNATFGNPPVYKYVNDVISNAYTQPNKAGGGGGGGGGGDFEEADPMSRGETAEAYGFVEGLFDSNPELKKLFDKAVKGQWSTGKFQAELRDTKWWKSHSDSERKYLTLRYGDPATAKKNYNDAYVQVRQLAAKMGMVETAANMKRLNSWAYNVAAKGWSEAQLRNEIGKWITFGEKWQGEGGEVQDALHEYAYNMGVTMSGDWYAKNTRNVIRGIATQQDYEDEIRRQSKAMYAQFSKQIDAGQTVLDLASPYIQSMAQILELPPGSVTLQDSTMKKALQYKDPATGKLGVKPLWQFENDLRNDPRWKKTKNAQDSLMQVAHQVLADFGVKY